MSDWEHLQNVLMQVHNRIVRDEFRDLDADDDDITTPRTSLRSACLVRDSDSATTVLNRFFLFYVMIGKASDFHPPLYTMPIDRYQQSVVFQPQVTLYFKEDLDDVADGFAPIDAALSFRIQHETEDTISQAELIALTNKIRAEFATGSGYRWRKGRLSMSYRDLKKGYRLRVQAYSEAEGREVIGKILGLQGDTIERSNLNINQLDEAPPIIPETKTILGKRRRMPRRRPVGWVRFIYAEAHVWGVPNPIILLDRSGRRRNPLVSLR